MYSEMIKLNKEHNNIIKQIYVCHHKDKYYDGFISKTQVIKEIFYSNKSFSLYKSLKFRKPGLFECFGFCQKSLYNNMKRHLKEKPVLKIKKKFEFNQQLGGTILVNNQGKIVFFYRMKYQGDFCPPNEIISFLKSFFKLNILGVSKVNIGIENKNDDDEKKSKQKIKTVETNLITQKSCDLLLINK